MTRLYLDFSPSVEGKILELGCGTGRILIPTAVAGYHIWGLDLSEHMLAKDLQDRTGVRTLGWRCEIRAV